MRGRHRALIFEATIFLLLAQLWLMIAPFRVVARRLGEARSADQAPECPKGSSAGLAREIGWAVRLAAAHVPFRAVCLQQGVAAKLMLRRRGVRSILSLGVAAPGLEQEPLLGHAWLDAEGVRVTGYPIPPNCRKVACFV